MKAECGYELYWYGCYRGTYDLIVPDSFAHPAKMAAPLCFRILEHLQELGLLEEGDIVLDPMAGTGMTNICAGAMGYSSISVELEEKFVSFQKENKEYAERKLYKSLDWQMIQGDSRQLSELLKDKGLVSVTSPPYSEAQSGGGISALMRGEGSYKLTTSLPGSCYQPAEHSENPANIANLKDTPLKAITSPPYGESLNEKKNTTSNLSREERLKTAGHNPKEFMGGIARNCQLEDGMRYSHDEDNIGNLPDKPLKSVMSPPYLDVEKRDRSIEASGEKEVDYVRGDHNISAGYQGNPDNIGHLDDKPLKSVMSPPYEDSLIEHSDKAEQEVINKLGKAYMTPGRIASHKRLQSGYADKSSDNVGNERGESYLEAMLQVYGEIAKVSDVLCVVVKNPTRNGRIRRLDQDTIKILELSGWKLYCQHRALLFEEMEQADFFNGSKKQVKGRLSFFKRLSWQKGNPVASWEDILVCVRK